MGNPYLYMAKIFYGLLSFPFLIFALGPLQDILTKSRPTAYDKHGNTIPKKKKINIKYLENVKIDINDMFNEI